VVEDNIVTHDGACGRIYDQEHTSIQQDTVQDKLFETTERTSHFFLRFTFLVNGAGVEACVVRVFGPGTF